MSERRGVTFERLARMRHEYIDDDDVLDVISAVEGMDSRITDLQRQLAEATGQAEAAKQATREIMAERNTWARQLADMRDERDTARKETELAQEILGGVSTDRTNLHIEMDILAQEYASIHSSYCRGDAVARDIRRVIARWETT